MGGFYLTPRSVAPRLLVGSTPATKCSRSMLSACFAMRGTTSAGWPSVGKLLLRTPSGCGKRHDDLVFHHFAAPLKHSRRRFVRGNDFGGAFHSGDFTHHPFAATELAADETPRRIRRR